MKTAKPVIDKDESQRIRLEIRRVLLESWDPIGIADEPYAEDEYDGYLGPIFEFLVQGRPDRDIVEYLLWIVNERMGLSGTAGSRREHQVQAVVQLRRVRLNPA